MLDSSDDGLQGSGDFVGGVQLIKKLLHLFGAGLELMTDLILLVHNGEGFEGHEKTTFGCFFEVVHSLVGSVCAMPGLLLTGSELARVIKLV